MTQSHPKEREEIHTMTREEVKDKIAQEREGVDFDKVILINEVLVDEICDLYARSKWDEACEAQRALCEKEVFYRNHYISTDVKLAILNSKKPEFKPLTPDKWQQTKQ